MFGLDYLGGARYGDLILREHPQGWAAGSFGDTVFGPTRWVQPLLASGRCPLYRRHAVWADDHVYVPSKHDPIILKELRYCNDLKQKYPDVIIQFSPFCEHRMDAATVEWLFDRLYAQAIGLQLVNAAERGARVWNTSVLEEGHGALAPTNARFMLNFSFDGLNAVDADVDGVFTQRYVSGISSAEVAFFFWHPRLNGRWNMKDKTPRKERKAWPDSRLIDSLIALSADKGNVKLAKGAILKSHAENHGPDRNGKPDAKGDKCLVILPSKHRYVDLVAENGQVVERFGYFGTYDEPGKPTRYRYYSDEWGYQLANKARRIQRHAVVKVIAEGGKQFGTCNPAFRENEWRNK